MDTENDDRLGSYLLGPRIGRGASGVVRHATSSAHTDPVAIKILREDLADDERTVARFLREKRIISDVDHPNVVKVHDLVVEEDQLGIVMELVDGGDLRALMKGETLTIGESVELTRQIAVGLTHLHELGILHRDLKPANVLVGGEGGDRVAKITDFGVSWLVGETMTRLTTTVGTPLYMAPEIATAKGPAEPSDVYALGVMFYEMLTGGAPFHGGSPMAIIMAHSRNPTPELRGLPSGLAGLVSSMMAKIPEARPTAAEVAQRLGELAPLIDDDTIVSTASPITGQILSDEEAPPPPVLVGAAGRSTDGLVPAAMTGVVELFRRRTQLAAGSVAGLLLLAGLLFAVTRDDTEAVAADAPDRLPSADVSGTPTSDVSQGSGDRSIGNTATGGSEDARGRFGSPEVALGPTTLESRPEQPPVDADDALAPVGPSTSRPSASTADRSGTTVRGVSTPSTSGTSTSTTVPSSASSSVSTVTSTTDGANTSTSRVTTSTTERTTTTRATTSTTRPITTRPTTTTTRPTTSTTERTTTTRATTSTTRPITTRPTTTTTRPTTSTTERTTTTAAGSPRQISIVSGPRVVSVGRTSAVFNYTTNSVCGTGSFVYREQATGAVVGSWTGDRGCFGPTHEGRTSWGGGIPLQPGTTYVVSITVDGQPTNGSLPTGVGRDGASLIVTTAP